MKNWQKPKINNGEKLLDAEAVFENLGDRYGK